MVPVSRTERVAAYDSREQDAPGTEGSVAFLVSANRRSCSLARWYRGPSSSAASMLPVRTERRLASPCSAVRRRRLDVVRNRVDQMGVVPVLSNRAGMGARAAANVENSRRRRWEIATD